MASIYTTRDGDVLDLICHRHYGRQSGAVEAVLEANPRLADKGQVYPHGLRITMPDLPRPSDGPKMITLWD